MTYCVKKANETFMDMLDSLGWREVAQANHEFGIRMYAKEHKCNFKIAKIAVDKYLDSLQEQIRRI
jgi:hypothetical protein